MADIYCKPILELGTGLGNRLFPWARCVLYARTHGAAMIDPVWMRPAIGQLFRGGIDYRSYLGQLLLFRLFRHGDRNLGVLAGFVRSRGASIVEEAPSTAAATFSAPESLPRNPADSEISAADWSRVRSQATTLPGRSPISCSGASCATR